ncbi:MAG: amidohydrolase family protein, partial [Pirellulales bacterium]
MNAAHPRLTRRELLKTGAVALTGAALPLESAVAWAGPTTGKAIDAHVHVWTPDTKRYPLAAGFSPEEMKPKSFTPEQLLAHARPVGVGRIVLIQMSFYGFDNHYMLDTMRAFPGVFSGVAVIDENAAGVRDTMRELKKQGVRGFRLHHLNQPLASWLSSGGMTAMWKTCADEQSAMCFLINPDALVPLDKLCQQYPDTPVVIDHFGRIGEDGTIRQTDLDNLCRLARHKNTHVKVSAFYALGKKKSP